MLLQRLINDPASGFNYDYMGAAEYENGATKNGRIALARLYLAGNFVARRIQLAEKMGRMTSPPISVLAMGSAETLDRLGDQATIKITKAPLRIRQASYSGWMNVGDSVENTEPLMFVRLDAPEEEIVMRVRQFLDDPIKGERVTQ